ncbi:hypothetical protein Curi_c16450 [Gottschalkia acidurici 9a]|uniref:Uncharacterized protein n=1 Tax=Gottschalkia acidurici (strain ATCC 7906 / DSM 604 / BCRC 14475 / CIP 104303 / KCTC 5404 / NCIMB 10678 / 9a) TaxID=1128398 RepID=K0B0P8_GOTA9|nr:hypothetical protein [Gottschalkia acidurici]AFS78652.1 hypothetical protein Curi_c16450 [Gottschalkia acidurici 9a]
MNYDMMLGKYISYAERVLPNDELNEVKHYYKHCEYEMALEGLLIELINTGKYPENFKYDKWEELVVYYDLNNESVFNEDIWDKFVLWEKKFN